MPSVLQHPALAPREDRGQFSISLPSSMMATLRAVAAARPASLGDTVEAAVRAHLQAVRAEAGRPVSPHLQRYKGGTQMTSITMPVSLMQDLKGVAAMYHTDDGRVKRGLSHVIKRCLAKQFAGMAVEPLPDAFPDPAPLARDKSGVLVVALPQAMRNWLAARGLAPTVRKALDVELPLLAADAGVNRTTMPSRTPAGSTHQVSVRVPAHQLQALREVAEAKQISASALARLCVARHIRAVVSQSH